MEGKMKQIPFRPEYADRLFYLSNRSSYLIVSAILLLALIVRIIALLDLKDSIYFDFFLLDEKIYHILSQWVSEPYIQ
jgi:hypothetical protein